MKILEVAFTLQSGGAERFVVDLSNELVKNGHDVTLLTTRDIEKNPDSAFFTDILDKKITLQQLKVDYPGPLAWYKVSRILKSVKPDVVHMHLNTLPYFFPHAL